MGYFYYNEELTTYRRRLPHWVLADGIYFVTFRLADSLPRTKIDELHAKYRADRDKLKAKKAPPDAYEALFELFHMAELDGALDEGLGCCVLGREEIAKELWDSIFHFDGERYEIIAVAIMPNHVHVIFRMIGDHGKTFDIVGAWKSFTYNAVRKKYGVRIPWQEECFDRLIRDEKELLRAAEYVLANPAAAGLANWPWVGKFRYL